MLNFALVSISSPKSHKVGAISQAFLPNCHEIISFNSSGSLFIKTGTKKDA